MTGNIKDDPSAGKSHKSGQDTTGRRTTDAFYKTKVCRHFNSVRGRCRKGASCPYAHSDEELRAPPDLSKTRLCDLFLKGKCTNRDCVFAHTREELRATQDLYKTSVCRFWLAGKCKAGEHCRHAHGNRELRNKVQAGKNSPGSMSIFAAFTGSRAATMSSDGQNPDFSQCSTATTVSSQFFQEAEQDERTMWWHNDPQVHEPPLTSEVLPDIQRWRSNSSGAARITAPRPPIEGPNRLIGNVDQWTSLHGTPLAFQVSDAVTVSVPFCEKSQPHMCKTTYEEHTWSRLPPPQDIFLLPDHFESTVEDVAYWDKPSFHGDAEHSTTSSAQDPLSFTEEQPDLPRIMMPEPNKPPQLPFLDDFVEDIDAEEFARASEAKREFLREPLRIGCWSEVFRVESAKVQHGK